MYYELALVHLLQTIGESAHQDLGQRFALLVAEIPWAAIVGMLATVWSTTTSTLISTSCGGGSRSEDLPPLIARLEKIVHQKTNQLRTVPDLPGLCQQQRENTGIPGGDDPQITQIHADDASFVVVLNIHWSASIYISDVEFLFGNRRTL